MSGALRDVVADCPAKDPAARPSAQYAQQLLINGTPPAPAQVARKQPQVRPPWPRKKRGLRVPVISGIAVVAVIGVVGLPGEDDESALRHTQHNYGSRSPA